MADGGGLPVRAMRMMRTSSTDELIRMLPSLLQLRFGALAPDTLHMAVAALEHVLDPQRQRKDAKRAKAEAEA